MSDDITKAFEQAAEDVKGLSEAPDGVTMLELYGLYKQSSKGDCLGDRPGMMDFVGRAKFDAWNALKGTSQTDAKHQYIALVRKLQAADKK